MKATIEHLAELGRRLENFGSTPESEAVIREACAANAWFTPASVRAAVEAIRCEMLDPELLAAWLAPYRVPVSAPKNMLVIMAGNIPLVGFFDLLCVVASGHRAWVKPSSKDRVLIDYLIEQMRRVEPRWSMSIYNGVGEPDAVIATGSDNTNRYFRARYGHLPTLLRGSRQSVAVLAGDETEEELRGLEEDIWLHNGLGCRNVSFVMLPVGCAFPAIRPRALNPKYRNNYRQTKALCQMSGRAFIDLDGAVAVEQGDFPHALSELSYMYYASRCEAEAWLLQHDRALQCVVSRCVEHPRRVDFGRAQHPTLMEYPDAVDVVAFLQSL